MVPSTLQSNSSVTDTKPAEPVSPCPPFIVFKKTSKLEELVYGVAAELELCDKTEVPTEKGLFQHPWTETCGKLVIECSTTHGKSVNDALRKIARVEILKKPFPGVFSKEGWMMMRPGDYDIIIPILPRKSTSMGIIPQLEVRSSWTNATEDSPSTKEELQPGSCALIFEENGFRPLPLGTLFLAIPFLTGPLETTAPADHRV